MTPQVQQLVEEAADLTGEAPPDLLSADAPVLVPDALASEDGGALYLVGIIGGKDVGKSSLVNALVGRSITPPSSSGRGTETVIAYAHASCEPALQDLLSREVPGKFRIITHDNAALSRQVLLDLPDIDSVWEQHLQVTRRMLRHMLYPVWIQSVEKYADRQPQQLLGKVAEGNDPANFVFCLNKIDQLVAREGAEASEQIRDDYAARIARVLGLRQTPRVFLISATQPQRFDLPELRTRLARQKDQQAVAESQALAGRRQDRSLLGWLEQRQLPRRLERLDRLLDEAQERLADRVGVPLMDRAIPAMLSDPSYRASVVEPAVAARLRGWPIVGALNAVLSPLVSVVQRNIGSGAGAVPPIDLYLELTGLPLASLVQTTFAQLHQTDAAVGELYRSRRLWDAVSADAAANDLRLRLASVAHRQRDEAVQRYRGGISALAAPFRWLLTIGAVAWFPLVQPLLEAVLRPGVSLVSIDLVRLIVGLLSGSHLLTSLSFLALWFVTLWVLLRYGTVRQVGAMLSRWSRGDLKQRDLSPAAQVLDWLDDLLAPVRSARGRLESLVDRYEQAKRQAEG